MVPPPSLMPPFQTAHAFLIMTAPQVRQRRILFLRSPLAFLFGRDHLLPLCFGLWRRRTRCRGHLARRDEFAFGFVELTRGLVVTLALHAVFVHFRRSRVTLAPILGSRAAGRESLSRMLVVCRNHRCLQSYRRIWIGIRTA